MQKGFAIQPAFENTLADNYHAPLTPLDFIANPEAARSQINRWTEEHTKEKIKDLLPAGSLDAQTRLVLTSAIYFYGKWQDPFVTSRTQPAPFTLPTGATAQANFMNQTAHFGYTRNAVRPDPGNALRRHRNRFRRPAPEDRHRPCRPGEIADTRKPDRLARQPRRPERAGEPAEVPRANPQFSLRKALSAMGMPTAFTAKADFSGIDPKRGLAISEVVHKAFVDVSEQGTEAAAATGIAVHATAMRMPEPPVVFRADHPFLFLIRDTRTGVVLFIGRLMNPQ